MKYNLIEASNLYIFISILFLYKNVIMVLFIIVIKVDD